MSVALASCTREPMFYSGANDVDPNAIAFTVETQAGTKAGAVLSSSTVNLGKDASGQTMILQETVTRIGDYDYAPETKGTPINSTNVINQYRTFRAYLYDEDNTLITDYSEDNDGGVDFTVKSVRWEHTFASNPLDAVSPLTFVMFMPQAPNFSLLANGKIEITTEQPASVGIRDQKDLLVSKAVLTKETYEPAAGFSTTFYHPLVGIRFKLGNMANNTQISQISLHGIINNGKGIFDPSDGETDWTAPASGEAIAASDTCTYSFNLETHLSDGTIDTYGSVDNGGLTYTFWLIPQTLTDDAYLSFYIKTDNLAEKKLFRVNLNEALGQNGNPVEWKAGDLHVFTIAPNFIEIKTAKTEGNGIKITNIGNIDGFIRAAVSDLWKAGDFVVAAGNGSFSDFPGSGWTLKDDGFYYTDQKVAAGADAPTLFTGYTPSSAPTLPDGAPAPYWSLDVAVQGVVDDTVWEN